MVTTVKAPKMSKREKTIRDLEMSGFEATPEVIRWFELPMERRINQIREALDRIISASFLWNNEVGDAIAKLPKEDRLDFANLAGTAVTDLGRYIAATGRT